MEKIKEPMVSIIMGIYNCESTISDAIDSILNQSFQNYEFILCDDGSTDHTLSIAKRYAQTFPNKIILIRNDVNRGLNYTLNRCISVSRGKYIARMDGDDLSLPLRLEKEVAFLERHSEFAIVGTSRAVFDDKGIWGKHVYPKCPKPKDLVRETPFAHPTCMVRKEAYKKVNGYSEGKRLLRVEDYHLWVKMYGAGFKGANLPEVLYKYRDDRVGYQKRKFRYRLNEAYVKLYAIKTLHLPVSGYFYVLKPILVGMLPYHLYNKLHKWKLKK